MIATNIQELRDQCGNPHNKNKTIYANFPFDVISNQDDWESEWATMQYFAKHQGAIGIAFTDWNISY